MLTTDILDSDIISIAANMRMADRMEVAAASGLDPHWVLTEGIRLSSVSMVYRDPAGTPVFIVGVVSASGMGAIWLLGTDDIRKHKRKLHKLAAQVVAKWHERWPTLGNLVDARNTVHIRWLKSMGFTFSAPVIAGVAQIPFLPFHRTVPHV